MTGTASTQSPARLWVLLAAGTGLVCVGLATFLPAIETGQGAYSLSQVIRYGALTGRWHLALPLAALPLGLAVIAVQQSLAAFGWRMPWRWLWPVYAFLALVVFGTFTWLQLAYKTPFIVWADHWQVVGKFVVTIWLLALAAILLTLFELRGKRDPRQRTCRAQALFAGVLLAALVSVCAVLAFWQALTGRVAFAFALAAALIFTATSVRTLLRAEPLPEDGSGEVRIAPALRALGWPARVAALALVASLAWVWATSNPWRVELVRDLPADLKSAYRFDVSPSGRYLIFRRSDGDLTLYDIEQNRVIRSFRDEEDFGVTEVILCADDRRYLVLQSRLLSETRQEYEYEGTVVETTTGRTLRTMHVGPVRWLSVEFSPDGSALLWHDKGVAHVLHIDQDGPPVELKGHTAWVGDAAFAPDSQKVLTVSTDYAIGTHPAQWQAAQPPDRTARIWDAKTGECLRILKGHASGLFDGAWHPDGSRVFTHSFDGTVRCWDATTGEALWSVKRGIVGVASIMVLDAHTLLLGDGYGGCELLDARTGKTLRKIAGQLSVISIHGHTLVTAELFVPGFQDDGIFSRELPHGSRSLFLRERPRRLRFAPKVGQMYARDHNNRLTVWRKARPGGWAGLLHEPALYAAALLWILLPILAVRDIRRARGIGVRGEVLSVEGGKVLSAEC